MGVYSAAKALDLDFIDIAYEEYDFVTYVSYLNDPKVKWFIDVLKSEEFIDEAKKLGGYTLEECGRSSFYDRSFRTKHRLFAHIAY